jgi:hypothetical protein
MDEHGNEHHAASTLDAFEHDIHIWVDFGMFLFSFCNAGVVINGIGALSWVIFISLVFGDQTPPPPPTRCGSTCFRCLRRPRCRPCFR